MKSLSTPAKETSTKEPNHLRILRISTLIMTLIMIIGFVIIVTLLSIAINKNIKTQSLLKIEPKVVLNETEVLNAVTYLPDYTILVLTKNKDVQLLRFLSNKTGKILSNVLVSDLISEESRN